MMFKIAAVMWIIIGAVFAGSAVVAILSTPSLADQAIRYVPMAGIGGYILAIHVAYLVSRRLGRALAS
jgi:hypothetical protein